MKSKFSSKKNKKLHSLDSNRVNKIKKILKKKKNINRSVIYNTSSLQKDIMREITGRRNEKEEISLLSNANVNIIKILNTCANDDILNDSSYMNDDHKERSLESITNWKKRMCAYEVSPVITHKKSKNLKNNNIFKYNSNISDFSLESKFSERKNETFKMPVKSSFSNKNTKEILSEEKLIKKKNMNLHYSIEPIKNNNQLNNSAKKMNRKKRERSKSISENYLNRNNKYNNINVSPTVMDMNNNMKYSGFFNEIEIMKINENIHNDINFIQLKKKISKLKKSFKNKNDLIQNKTFKNNNSPLNKINTIKELYNENNEESSDMKDSHTKLENSIKKKQTNIALNTTNNSKKIAYSNKYRVLIRRKEVYDSIDDEELKEEEIDYYISPDSIYIKIFDSLLFISSLIYFICVPFLLSKNYFIVKENNSSKIIFMSIDIIYILDIILGFFRAYHNYDEYLIRKAKKIFYHYLRTWFLLDFIQAIPYYSIIKLMEHYIFNDNKLTISLYGYHTFNPRLYILLLFKITKLYKMFNNNSTIAYYSEILSRNEIFDDHKSIILTFFITIFFLNLSTCLFIFLGNNAYPGWIIKLNIQDESYIYIYLTSVYFIIVTITTVGYGDITGGTFPEIAFQIFLLIIGTIAYSFTISYISNYIIKSNQKSMTFEKHLEILQEIKLHHPKMEESLYKDVLRNIYNEQLYERKDKHLLFDCLPYSLKNKLIMEMYKPIIKNFVFFKDIDNSDFIVKVITSLKPLISFKGDIVIQEGDYIKEVIFIKKGIIALNICIDLDEPELSLKKYFGNNEIGKFDISYTKSNILKKKSLFRSLLINKTNAKINNYEDIKIIEIRAKEHFGDALMFLNERCPIFAKVRTKTAELLILRKMEAFEIYSIYPNIWKRINKKALYNMDQIYLKIQKIVIELSHRYSFNIDNYLNKKKKSNIKKKDISSNNKEQEITKNEETNAETNIEKNKENNQIVFEKKENILDHYENHNHNMVNKNLYNNIN